jgi:hypothetical protein
MTEEGVGTCRPMLSCVQSEFSDIEFNIRWATKETPKKEADSRFQEAERHITDDIDIILANMGSG